MAIGLTNQQKKAVLWALLAVIAAWIDFTFVLRLQWNSYKRISAKLQELSASLGQYNKNSSYYRNLVLEYGRLQKKHADIEKNVYSEAAVPLFLDDISKLAYSFDVKIMQVKPKSVSADKTKGADKALSLNFHPLLFEFDLSCAYHQLGKFLSALERNPLVEVSAVKVASEGEGSLRQKAALTLKVYVQKK